MGLLTWQYQVIGLLFVSLNLHAATLSSSPNISSFFPTLPYPCLPDQRLALLQLKSYFTIDSAYNYSPPCTTSYPKTESWKEGVDCCVWDGVTCDRLSGHVIGLDLSCAWISAAPIYSNSTLFLLTRLQYLNLAFNFFGNSPIPSKFGQFSSLTHLNLSHSSFTGLVPPEMALLSKLVSLDLSRNNSDSPRIQFKRHSFKELLQNLTKVRDLVLDGTDMSFVTLDSFHNLSSSIRCLSLRDTRLQGNFPKYVFQLPNLQELNIYANRLNGSLPEFNLSSHLKILDLSQTGFSGNLPSSIGNLKSLIVLNLEYCNGFVGSLPATIGNLTRTTSLILDSNNFTGQIPASLSNLASLVKLSFELNNFFGPLPDVFYNLTKLTYLGFAQNSLSGPIPSSIFNLNQLSTLRLFSNQLSGSLPHEVSKFSELNYVDLSHNLLNGNLPAWFFMLPSLAHLDLSDNQLTGQLPEFLSKSFVYLNLSKNKIQGPVPSSIFELVNASYIDLASNNFGGTLGLHMFSKILNLLFLDLSDNILSLEVNKANFSWPAIQELHLSSCNITSFPLFLSNQSLLYWLSLSRNKIHEIPILNNTSLFYLDLSHNCLTKAPVFHSESRIVYLDISFNLIQGPLSPLINMIPEGMLWSVFLFSSNKFTGEIPSFLCNKSVPLIIDLSNNSLSGKIPQCLGTLGLLSVLNLGMNNLSGSIPQNFSKARYLRNLDLSGNQLEGPLPQSLVNCQSLEVLDLGSNKFESRFPFWLESLPELQVLVLRSNRFHGPIVQTMSSFPFPKLRILDLSSNAFTGPLPIKYFRSLKAMMSAVEKGVERKYMGQGTMLNKYYQDSVVVTIKNLEIRYDNILTIFATIDLSNNKFEGQIPAALGNLNSLKGLNLSHNTLSGLVQSSLANLTALESLDFSYNKLVGGIPQQLTNLNFLAVLNLSYNQLEGPIPQGSQFNTFNNDSYFGNPRLCGSPLTMHCRIGDAPPPLPPTLENDFSGGFDWKFAMMGYGSGLVIGLSIAYMVFARGEPLWFAKMVEMLRGRFNKKSKKAKSKA